MLSGKGLVFNFYMVSPKLPISGLNEGETSLFHFEVNTLVWFNFSSFSFTTMGPPLIAYFFTGLPTWSKDPLLASTGFKVLLEYLTWNS